MVRPTSPATKPPSPPQPRAAFPSHPSDLELIEYYLRPWVASGLKAGPFIHEADVYAADPADLVREFSPAVARDGERAWYFLCPLRRKNGRGRRKARTVASGEGCWHNEAKSKPVISGIGERHQVGHRQSFSFVKKEGGVRVRTGWLMMELRLLADGGAQEDAPGSLVLCKVYRSPRNPERSDEEPTAVAVAASSSGPKAESNDDSSSAATAAVSGPKEKTNDNASSDASLAAPEREKKPKDEEESSAGTVAAPKRPRKADDEISGAATEAPPKRLRKADDETSGAITAAAPTREETADGKGSAETSAAAPGRKRKAADDESSVAASAPPAPTPAPKRRDDDDDGDGAPATGLICCPNCGTHIAAGEAVVAAAKSKSETKSETEIVKDESKPTPGAPQGGETGGPSENRLPFTFL